jgi:hypothetical protein
MTPYGLHCVEIDPELDDAEIMLDDDAEEEDADIAEDAEDDELVLVALYGFVGLEDELVMEVEVMVAQLPVEDELKEIVVEEEEIVSEPPNEADVVAEFVAVEGDDDDGLVPR